MVITVKRNESLYQKYTRLYGQPQLTRYGEHVWEQVPEKFVRDAKTGKILERTMDVKYIGKSPEGLNFYLGPKSRLTLTDKAIPSFYK